MNTVDGADRDDHEIRDQYQHQRQWIRLRDDRQRTHNQRQPDRGREQVGRANL